MAFPEFSSLLDLPFRLARTVRDDAGRFFGAGFIALVLWFLLGEKVRQEEQLVLEVRVLQRGETAQGSGLFVRLPPGLALADVSPRRVELRIAGPAEDLARLEGTVRGYFDVPSDFTGGSERVTREVGVAEDFQFPRLKSLAIDILESPRLLLTVARRATGSLVLSRENLRFTSPDIAKEVEVEFEPSAIRITGPMDLVRLVRDRPSMFMLAEIDGVAAARAMASGFVVPAGQGTFLGEDGPIDALEVVDPDLRVRIRFIKRPKTFEVVLEDVEVAPLVPPSARRTDVREEDPITLSHDRVTVRVIVPADKFADEKEAKQRLRRDLNLFVDLGEMPFGTNAMKLRVHYEGLPEGSKIEIDPPEIDVIWNPKEPQSGAESGAGG